MVLKLYRDRVALLAMAAAGSLMACVQILGDDFSLGQGGAGGSGGADGGAGPVGPGGAGGMGGGAQGGAGGDAPLMCDPGTGNCNGDDSDGCEVTLASDGDNCGVCGHDCLGGACASGVCRAVELATGNSTDFPRSVAVDAANVYWTNESAGNVQRVPISGGVPINFGFSQNFAYGITVDSTHVYWSRRDGNSGAIVRVGLGGGGAQTLVSGLTNPEDMANDANHVYWGCSSTGIRRLSKSDFTVEILAETASFPTRIALDTSWVYFTQYQSGRIMRVRKNDSSQEQLYDDQGGALGIDVDQTGAYWVNFINNEVRSVGLDGSNPRLLSSAAAPRGIVVDDTFAYYTESGANQVMRVVKDGSAQAEVFAQGQNGPRGITQDAVAVYWVNVDGSAWKRAKDPVAQ